MNESKWKLGEDLHENDAIFDQITFNDIILSLHCNERVIDRKAAFKVFKEIMEIHMQDFEYLFNNNIDEIITKAKEGRE